MTPNPRYQAIFDHIYTTLKSQGFKQSKAPSKTRNGIACCVLRDPQGCVCAVGSIIDPGKYDPKLEQIRFHDLLSDHTEVFLPQFGLTVADLDLIHQMVMAHDGGQDPLWMQENLQNTANRFGLTVPLGTLQ